ncbi:uncharacterized protein LOC129909753 [Episyrphus balteatus]|uniref:uncharacterized protein LOC129909753 n=1 Tax=Episyrphus balteatus TaxID=286459 RepID=UPI002486CB6A|nr:uncharacterized protein LOC129909753 [Episyrphus balteatus]
MIEIKYNNSDKIWQSSALNINYSSLGEAIFSKLNESDPDRIIEVNHESDIKLTVNDIRHQTIIVAKNLQKLGVKKGDTVILFSRSNSKVTPVTFACYALGLPVNFFETSFQDDIIRHNFELLNPTLIIFEEEFRQKICKCLNGLQLPKLKHTLSLENDEVFQVNFDEEDEDFQPVWIEDPSQYPAALLFTSGSTGMPKIAIISHALMLQGLYNKWWPLGPDSIICSYADLRWIVQVQMMLQPLFFGGKRVYSIRLESAIPVKEKRQIIDLHKITHFCEVPMFYLDILASAEQSDNPNSLSSLRIALVAGEVVTETLVDYSQSVIPKCKVIKCYGMTEVAGAVCTNELISKYNLNGGVLKNGFMVKIVNDDGCSLGPNEAGRLCLKSAAPLLGYLKNEKANMKAYLDDGWYDTGDCACMDLDNLLGIGTRYHDLVRSSGAIIVPSVVEGIVNTHPSVLSSALVGHSSLKKDSKDEIGSLFVVIVNNDKFSNEIEGELRELIRNELTNEQFEIIRHIRIISEIPLKTCGKADRSALKILAEKLQN